MRALQPLRTQGKGKTSLTTPSGTTIEKATRMLMINKVVATVALVHEVIRSSMVQGAV